MSLVGSEANAAPHQAALSQQHLASVGISFDLAADSVLINVKKDRTVQD